jgi:hypothetical protein
MQKNSENLENSQISEKCIKIQKNALKFIKMKKNSTNAEKFRIFRKMQKNLESKTALFL